MPTYLIDLYGKRIRVRITSKRNTVQHETFVFDENRNNAFRTGVNGDGRFLYAPYLSESAIQIDSTTNAVVLDSTKPTATLNFVTRNDSSDFAGFALGYGLYYFKVEYPYKTCDIPQVYSWMSSSWIMDFRDSRFANSYAVDSAEDINFSIRIEYQYKQCGDPDITVVVTPRSGGDTLRLTNLWRIGCYNQFQPIQVGLIFGQTTPDYDFHINCGLYKGLDTTLKQQMSPYFDLTHSATIDTSITLDQSNIFMISNSFNGYDFVLERDSVVIRLANTCAVSSYGPGNNRFFIRGRSGNTVRISSSDCTKSTGFILQGLNSEISDAEMTLVKPIIVEGPSGGVNIRNTIIRLECYEGTDPLLFKDQPYAIRIANSQLMIDSCTVTVADPTVARGTGIFLENAHSSARISNCVIEGFPGHGIEIVDGPEINSQNRPSDIFWLDHNTIRNNRMYGVHIRGSKANPYLSGNFIYSNGWFGDNTPDEQSRKFDGVNIQSAAGIFQNNTFDSSGAYGLHASHNATIRSYGYKDIQSIGGNCFRRNYYNLGGSGNSVIYMGEDSTQGYNAFTSPRATWSDAFHVTLRNSCIGHLRGNAWENPYLSASPYPISKVDSAKSFKYPEYSGSPIHCVSSLFPGGAHSDSIMNRGQIDAIRLAVANGDWIQARDLSLNLLQANNDPFSAVFSATTLFDALQVASDPTIPSSLGLLARDTSKYYSSVAANYAAMKSFEFTGEYDSCLAMAGFLAQRYPYSDDWRIANLTTAFLQNDYLGNSYAAEDVLLAVLQYFPDDAESIGAYYSVKGILPEGFSKKKWQNFPPEPDDGENIVFTMYPNPAGRELTICFHLDEVAAVKVSLYDLSGNLVIDIPITESYTPGEYVTAMHLENVTNGYYHVILRVNERIHHKLVKIEQY